MTYKLTYYTDVIAVNEVELTNIDYSGVTYNPSVDPVTFLVRRDLKGSIRITGADFEYFSSQLTAGNIKIYGDFYINNIQVFQSDVALGYIAGIEYNLDAKNFDNTAKVAEFEITAKDEYYLLDKFKDKKLNIFESTATRKVLTCYKERSKLTFYQTEVTESKLFYSFGGGITDIYAREEITDATTAEINTLVGINDWILDGTSIVREWDVSGDFATPGAGDFDTSVSLFKTSPLPPINEQGDYSLATELWNESSDFLAEYTVLVALDASETRMSLYLLDNYEYYGAKNDYIYFTAENAIKLLDVCKFLIQSIDGSISNVVFDFLDRFDFANSSDNVYLQALTEISRALPYSDTITGTQQYIATKGYLTLNKVNTILREFLNVYYYRSGNTIYYKHYTDLFSLSATNNLTNTVAGNLTPTEVITYNLEDRFNRIVRNFIAENIDFIGLDAEFTNILTDNIKTVTSQNFYFDINDILGNSDKYSENSNESWVMVVRDGTNTRVIKSAQILSNRYETYMNEKLSVAFIDANFQVGSDKTSLINGLSKTLTDLFQYKMLASFEIVPNMINDLDFSGYFKTNYSDFHRLKDINLKLDGSPAEINLYYV